MLLAANTPCAGLSFFSLYYTNPGFDQYFIVYGYRCQIFQAHNNLLRVSLQEVVIIGTIEAALRQLLRLFIITRRKPKICFIHGPNTLCRLLRDPVEVQ